MPDDGENMATHDVTVMVTNMNEDGTVELDSTQPQVDTAITATLTDPDGRRDRRNLAVVEVHDHGRHVHGHRRRHVRQLHSGGSRRYLLTSRSMVTYTDVHDDGQTAMATTAMAVTSNLPPAFDMADTSREVAENTAAGMNIGDPVAATDPNGDTLTYMLGGDDAASFDIDTATGQLMTKDGLDYETKMSYMVTVTATDPDGESATINVTVNVTNVGLDTRYDANDDGALQLDEVYQAVDDYFDEEITLQDALDVIARYFDQTG